MRADCSLTSTGNIPLNDLGPRSYKGVIGGLYPGGSNTRPATHQAAAVDVAANQIKSLDRSGNPDPASGRIVMISIGMSNTTQEFASKGPHAFKPRADADPAKNPQLLLVDGAQGGQDAPAWADPNGTTWATLNQRLIAAGVTPQQVQVAWIKQALARPNSHGAFPAHAQKLQSQLEAIVRNMKVKFPNVKLAFLSTRTRAYTDVVNALNPEPFAYETGFAVKWTVENQITGSASLNFDAGKGAVVAPLLLWGPYIWADGLSPRSDRFTWLCSDLEADFTHPSASGGVRKVADQLLAFFKTDPAATPWFLRQTVVGQPPTVAASASISNGVAPLTVEFNANGSDPDGTVTAYQWTFDDGTFSAEQNPLKTFAAPGKYSVHLTVTDNNGNTVRRTLPISVAPASFANISTRLRVETGDNVLIGGFIVTGSMQKRIVVRALGPSLQSIAQEERLANPVLELYRSDELIATNDNWQDAPNRQEIIDSTIPPSHDLEAAILRNVDLGAYTAVVRGLGSGQGVGLIEVYDVGSAQDSKLANLSTRGRVLTADNVMIGGLIITGSSAQKVIVRAIGPSLPVDGRLEDPLLELFDGNGNPITSNDNWKDTQQAEIAATTIAPSNDLESAIVASLTPAPYTAIVRGVNDTTGVALVEVYALE